VGVERVAQPFRDAYDWVDSLFTARSEAERLREEVRELRQRAIQNEFAAMFTADAYASIGNHEDAIRWVTNAIEHGFINYPFLAEHDPFLASVRGDPGFKQLLAEVKPRWEAVVEWERRRQA